MSLRACGLRFCGSLAIAAPVVARVGRISASVIRRSYGRRRITPSANPPYGLRKPGVFGDQISFCAPTRFVPFATSPVIDDLIRRIDAARRSVRRA
jgi:hypothetical protein